MTLMHRQMGLKMNQLAEQKAERPELKAKTKEMAEDQQRDIERLNQMRSQLYPNAPKRLSGGAFDPSEVFRVDIQVVRQEEAR